MLLIRLKRGVAAFNKATSPGERLWSILVVVLVVVFCTSIIGAVVSAGIDAGSRARAAYRFNHLSSALHLEKAKAECGPLVNMSAHTCYDPVDALRHLERIPASAPQYAEASKLTASIKQQEHSAAVAIEQNAQQQLQQQQQQSEERQQRSRKQASRNVQGLSHDDFRCATSTDDRKIMSFDDGNSWWIDDGRCAAKEQKAAQAARDADAELYSYWSTTLRVDTDMNSSWLPSEERTCQTYPDYTGKISRVTCNSTGSHRDHNIPVKFWGGVSRNTVSDWKCRREKDLLSDEFVCWAID